MYTLSIRSHIKHKQMYKGYLSSSFFCQRQKSWTFSFEKEFDSDYIFCSQVHIANAGLRTNNNNVLISCWCNLHNETYIVRLGFCTRGQTIWSGSSHNNVSLGQLHNHMTTPFQSRPAIAFCNVQCIWLFKNYFYSWFVLLSVRLTVDAWSKKILPFSKNEDEHGWGKYSL